MDAKRRGAVPVLLTAVAGGALLAAQSRHAGFAAVDSPSSAIVVETLTAGVAVLLAAASYARWRLRQKRVDALVATAFAVLGATKVCFVVVPLLLGVTGRQRTAAALLGGVVAAAFLAVATWVRPEAESRPRGGLFDVTSLLLLVAIAVIAVALLGRYLATGVGALPDAPSVEATGDRGNHVVAVLQAATAGLFVVAAAGLVLRRRAAADTFLSALAVAATLWAASRGSYALTPVATGPYLNLGDWLRLAAYAVLAVGAGAEVRGYWLSLAEVRVLEERRRIAHDLHDGLAQELSFIATQTRALSAHGDGERLSAVARAAERALDESRRAIAALTRPVDEPLDVALAQQAEELGGRVGVRVILDLHPVDRVSPDAREALLRIAREAIVNAGRHGRPSKITVSLLNGSGLTMRVADDGRGFLADDPAVFAGDRWGVAGMKERAEALGGTFSLNSRPYGGTRVEVWIP